MTRGQLSKYDSDLNVGEAEDIQIIQDSYAVRTTKQLATKCLLNGAVTCKFKVLSSFNVLVSGTGRGFGIAPLRKHKRWRSWLKKDENTYDNIIFVNVDFLRTRE
jgi:hypothetical protein